MSWLRSRYRRARGDGTQMPIQLAVGVDPGPSRGHRCRHLLAGPHFLHVRSFRPDHQLSSAGLYDLLKVAFAVTAGIGAVVALVTAYRRQQTAELAQRTAEQAQELARQAEECAARDSQREHELGTTQLLNERYATASGQLADSRLEVRLAGVYAMAGLAPLLSSLSDKPGHDQSVRSTGAASAPAWPALLA